MWPFKKKYDIEKDKLTIEMPLYKMRYGIYKDGKEIDPNDCTERTRNELRKAHDEYMQKLKARSEELSKYGQEFSSIEVLSEKPFTMTKEMEDILMPLVTEENVVVGIHRVGSANMEYINDMLNNGVLLTGHGFNVQTSRPDINLNFGLYYDNRKILKEIANANSYKNSNGSIIIRIPDEDLSKEVYIYDNTGTPRINPKYIVGYFPANSEHRIDSIIRPTKKNENKTSYSYKYSGEQTNLSEEYNNGNKKVM